MPEKNEENLRRFLAKRFDPYIPEMTARDAMKDTAAEMLDELLAKAGNEPCVLTANEVHDLCEEHAHYKG